MKRILAAVACLVLAAVAAYAIVLRAVWPPKEHASSAIPTAARSPADVRADVVHFCGDCHTLPKPSSFPREAWFDEVERGFAFYYASGRHDLKVPVKRDVLEFFRSQAPEQLSIPTNPPDAEGKPRFRSEEIGPVDDRPAALSFLRPIAGEADSVNGLLFTDMESGVVGVWSAAGAPLAARAIAKLTGPAHVEPCDLDGDGRRDFVVAELGSVIPEDHDRGRVTWLRATGDGNDFEPVVVRDKLGRVADVRPADFDGDGDVDLVVGEFGWQTTGRIFLLENTASGGAAPKFELREVDPRHGTIHVPVVDLNGDGRPDFIALISQEHEAIVAFLNQGGLKFQPQVIYAADDPSYGSSGIQVVDLDQDGNLDVLYTNGDTLDSQYVKPYHGVQWLENTGGFPFKHHPLGAMPGVSRAMAGDLDGDGDHDIAAIAYLPRNVVNRFDVKSLDSVVWLEQTSPGSWTRHSLEQGVFHHMSLELLDLDGDKDLELISGHFGGTAQSSKTSLTVWWNSPE